MGSHTDAKSSCDYVSLIVRPDDDRMTVETCCLSWPSYVNKSMYCSADVYFIVFYLLALLNAFSKIQEKFRLNL